MSNDRHPLQIPEGASVGQLLRIARVAARLEQAEMAEAIGVSVRTYQRIEDGERPVKRLELVALADRTGQDISFFGASSENGEAGTVNRSEGRVKPEGRLVG